MPGSGGLKSAFPRMSAGAPTTKTFTTPPYRETVLTSSRHGFLLELLSLEMSNGCVDERLELAVHHLWKLVNR